MIHRGDGTELWRRFGSMVEGLLVYVKMALPVYEYVKRVLLGKEEWLGR